jgi:hypothetical protein
VIFRGCGIVIAYKEGRLVRKNQFKKGRMRIYYFFVLFLTIGVAQGETTQFSGSFNTSLNSDFRQTSDINKGFYSSSGLNISAEIPKLFTVSTGLSYAKDFVGERSGEIEDTSIAISRLIKEFNTNYSLSGSASIFIPVSKDSREVTFLNTGYRLGVSLTTLLPQIPKLISTWGLNFVQNFHNSDTTEYGDSNKQFLVSITNRATYPFLKHFKVSMSIAYTKGFTYQGSIIDTVTGGQELGYNASEKLNFALGHSLGGNIFKPNGQYYNLTIFDANRSKFYLEMNLGF